MRWRGSGRRRLKTALADLTVSLGGPLPALLHRPDLPERAAGLLEWVWTECGPARLAAAAADPEADMIARTGAVEPGAAGPRPWTTCARDALAGEGRLQINAYDYPPREICGGQLLFVPVTPRQGWASWDEPHRYAVVYPCSGVLAEADRAAGTRDAGCAARAGRAGVLVLLDTPKSTSQLVALTGQGLGSVGRHLKVLLDAHLVGRRRAGRSVLYYRTAVGQDLVEAQRKR